MKHFNDITSLSDLKKKYRALALANHPDRGGDEQTMKEVNAEFEKLYEVWKNRAEVEPNGYESDYAGATAREYTSYVYNEYKFAGENFKKHGEFDNRKICQHVRDWLKEHYPSYKWHVNKSGYNSVNVRLMAADFHPFKDHTKVRGEVNKYWFKEKSELTDRAIEVFTNVIDYVQSWNFDDSDIMTDYFHVNFYSEFSVGGDGFDFKYEPIALKGDAPVFRRKAGPVERKVKEAMGAGNCFWHKMRYNRETNEYEPEKDKPMVLCSDDDNHCERWYSQPSLVKARLEKLAAVGIIAQNTRRGIELVGYTPELEASLKAEKEAEDAREREFYARRDESQAGKEQRKQELTADPSRGLSIVDYSEKAIAVTGDTRSIKDKLKELGGRFNAKLTCGPGWVFSKRSEAAVRLALGI